MLRKSLETLPRTLDQTYDRILCAISEEYSEYAMRILQWLTFPARPLSVEEVAEVVAIDVACDPAFNRDKVLEDPLEALNICSSLVTITTNEAEAGWRPAQRRLVLAHYSVQEYLLSDRIKRGQAKQYSMQEEECQNTIAKSCLKYLTQFQQPLSNEALETFALARYAANFWSDHLQKTGDNKEELSRIVVNLLSPGSPAYLVWIHLADPDLTLGLWFGVIRQNGLALPLYYAALLGLSIVARMLLDRNADVNAQGGQHGNALQAASYKGYKQVVKMLLDKGADINAQGGYYGNALQAALERGHEQIVKMLLDKGADANARGRECCNALYVASDRGHEQIVKMLLDKGADVNAQGGYYGNALQTALERGHEQIVKMLLDKGADVNAQGGRYGNALYAASTEGHGQTVKMLLDKGADVNAQGGYYGNALQAASDRGHKQIVKMLLDKGADVNAQGGEYCNALQAASERGHEQIVKMLLDKGANINARGGHYGNALQAASERGDKRVVEMLLDAGADKLI
jgi:ankyrin repeat protein